MSAAASATDAGAAHAVAVTVITDASVPDVPLLNRPSPDAGLAASENFSRAQGPSLAIDPALEEFPEQEVDDIEFMAESEQEAESAETSESGLEEPGDDGTFLEEPEFAEDWGLDLTGDLESMAGADAGTQPMPYPVPYMPDGKSLSVMRSIVVRSEPRQDTAPLGTLAQDMRVTWRQAMRGPGCDAWVEIDPRGWVCERYLEPNFREPRVRELPRVLPGQLTPSLYARPLGKRLRAYPSLALARQRKQGRLLTGAVTVGLRTQVRIGRRVFWRTADGYYIEARRLRVYQPSSFTGLDAAALAELPLPFAWAQSRTSPRAPVEVRVAPEATAARETVLPPRTLVAVRELSEDGLWARIADAHWVALDDLRVAALTPPPPEIAPEERWIDVDLSSQVLMAYEGERPVYATLVSSGIPGTDTPQGLYRIWLKLAEADMAGRTAKGRYRVATVPWTMFFQGDFALHTAYWHDRFGEPVSHGCINLAPKDARALYTWAAPETPLGWSMVYATPEWPGTWVRIREQTRVPGRQTGPLR